MSRFLSEPSRALEAADAFFLLAKRVVASFIAGFVAAFIAVAVLCALVGFLCMRLAPVLLNP
jgi:hypothetical protein